MTTETTEREIALLWEAIARVERETQQRADVVVAHSTELRVIHDAAHVREHLLSERAVDKTAETLNSRLEAMNEFRHQIETERATYVTTRVLDTELRGINDTIDQNARLRVSQLDAATKTMTERIAVDAARIDRHEAYINTQTGKLAVWGIVATIAVTLLTVLISYALRGS